MEFLTVVVAAFTLQLLALPGEKGQLVVCALSTRYDPKVVVAGAATAFGLWTAVEIAVGEALKGALPEAVLDAVTAGLFVLFAAWLLKAAEDGALEDLSDPHRTDGGVSATVNERLDVPDGFRGFLPAFSLMMFGEFGDKTQLVTISLAVQYGAHPGIWVGEMLAIVPVSLLTAFFFHAAADRMGSRWLHRGAAALFLLFAADVAAEYVLGWSVLPL